MLGKGLTNPPVRDPLGAEANPTPAARSRKSMLGNRTYALLPVRMGANSFPRRLGSPDSNMPLPTRSQSSGKRQLGHAPFSGTGMRLPAASRSDFPQPKGLPQSRPSRRCLYGKKNEIDTSTMTGVANLTLNSPANKKVSRNSLASLRKNVMLKSTLKSHIPKPQTSAQDDKMDTTAAFEAVEQCVLTSTPHVTLTSQGGEEKLLVRGNPGGKNELVEALHSLFIQQKAVIEKQEKMLEEHRDFIRSQTELNKLLVEKLIGERNERKALSTRSEEIATDSGVDEMEQGNTQNPEMEVAELQENINKARLSSIEEKENETVAERVVLRKSLVIYDDLRSQYACLKSPTGKRKKVQTPAKTPKSALSRRLQNQIEDLYDEN